MVKLLLVVLLAGCTTTEYIQVEPPQPPIIVRPELETDNLKPGDGPDKVISAFRVTIKRLQQYAMELETALEAYRKK